MKKFYTVFTVLSFQFYLGISFSQQWYPASSGGQTLNSVFFTSADTGYVVGAAGTILKTKDAGVSWTALSSGSSQNLLSVFFTDANNGYVGGENATLLKTYDAGGTWSLMNSSLTWNQHISSVFFTDANTGYATALSGKIIKTLNAGSSWGSLTSGTTNNLEDVFFDSSTGKGYVVGALATIKITGNGGSSWTSPANIGSSSSFTSVSFGDSNKGFAAGTNGAILKTIDGGQYWDPLISGVNANLNDIYFFDANTGYAAGAFGTILKTTDGGATWSSENSGVSNDLNAFFFTSSNTGYAVGSNGLILKTCNVAADAGFDKSICQGSSASLGGTPSASGGTAPYSFSWSSQQTLSDPAISNPIAYPTSNTKYFLTVSDSKGCSAQDSVNVTTYPPANAFISSVSNSSCFGVNDGSATVSGGNSFYWSNGQNTSTATGLAAGIYNVTVTNINGCTDSVSVTISQPTAFSGSITSTNASCYGQNDGTATASGSGGTSPYSFLWFNGYTGATMSNLSAGSYSVTISDANGCGNLAYYTTVSQPPSINVTVSSADVSCFGISDGTASVTASGGTGSFFYQWSNGSSSQSISGLIPANYSVTVSDAASCTVTGSATINQPSPIVASAGNDQTICNGNNAVLTASGGILFSWSTGGNTASIVVSPPASTNYFVTVSDSSGCSGTDTVTVWVNSNPVPVIIPSGPVSFCLGENVILDAGSFSSYSWSNGTNGSSITVSSAGNYSVTVTDANGCSGPVSQTVSVNPLPVADFSVMSVCFGNVIPFTNLSTISSGSFSSNWDFGDLNTSTLSNPAYSYSSDGSFNVSLIVISDNGCSDTVYKPAIVFPLPTVNAESDQSVCEGDSVQLSASGGLSYSWSPALGLSDAGIANPIAFPNYSTQFHVTALDANSCSGSDSVLVTVNANSDATINPVNLLCTNNPPISLTSVEGGGIWSSSPIPAAIVGNSFDPAIAGAGTHSITYIIPGTCGDSSTINITVIQEPDATINPAGPFCTDGIPVNLSTAQPGGTWSGNGIVDTLNGTFDPAVAGTGNHSIVYYFTGFCPASDSTTIVVSPCSFSVNGTIYDQSHSFSLNYGTVYLLGFDTVQTQLFAVDSSALSGVNGDYFLGNHPSGQYIVLFRPDTVFYPNAIPTYFGDTALWNGAQVINLVTDTYGIDISTREIIPQIGTGYISGIVQFGIGSGKTGDGNAFPFGDPVPGIDVSVEQVPGGIVRHSTTDNTGFYSFSDLLLNKIYRLLVDIPGLPMDSIYEVDLSGSDTVLTNLDYVVDTSSGSAGIYIGYPLTVINSGFSELLHIYPVPFSNSVNFEMVVEERSLINIEIFDITGRKVYSGEDIVFPGKYISEVDRNNLQSGLLHFRILMNGKIINSGKIVFAP